MASGSNPVPFHLPHCVGAAPQPRVHVVKMTTSEVAEAGSVVLLLPAVPLEAGSVMPGGGEEELPVRGGTTGAVPSEVPGGVELEPLVAAGSRPGMEGSVMEGVEPAWGATKARTAGWLCSQRHGEWGHVRACTRGGSCGGAQPAPSCSAPGVVVAGALAVLPFQKPASKVTQSPYLQASRAQAEGATVSAGQPASCCPPSARRVRWLAAWLSRMPLLRHAARAPHAAGVAPMRAATQQASAREACILKKAFWSRVPS